MSRIALDRVVLVADVDKPINRYGKSPGLDRVYDRRSNGPIDSKGNPVNPAKYDMFFEAGLVTIVDKESGHAECVPMHMVKQMRTVESVERGEKQSGAKPPPRGMQLP